MSLLEIIAGVNGEWDKLPKNIKSDVAETDTDYCHHCALAGVQTEATTQVDAVITIYRRNSEGVFHREEFWEDMKTRATNQESMHNKAYYLYARSTALVARGLCGEHTYVCENCGDPYSQMAKSDNAWDSEVTNHHRDTFSHIYAGMAYNSIAYNRVRLGWRWSDQVCPSCAEDTQECDACNALVNTNYESLQVVDGNDWCERCISDSDARWCDYCDSYHTEWCENNDDSDFDEGRGSGIHDYSFKPDAIFGSVDADISEYSISGDINWRSRVPFMGFELEVEAPIASMSNGIELIKEHLGDDERYVYLKSDGSLNYGFEIVSHPCTLAVHKEMKLAETLKGLSDLGFRSWRTDTCGLHVHVSRNGFSSPSHIWKFTHFIVDNKEAMVKLAGRNSDRWATFTLDGYASGGVKSRAKGANYYNRYEAINFNNLRTLELRFFKGSLRAERVLSALELTEGAVEYTRNLTSKDIMDGGLNFRSFVAWLRERADKYPNLLSYVDTLGIADCLTAKASWQEVQSMDVY